MLPRKWIRLEGRPKRPRGQSVNAQNIGLLISSATVLWCMLVDHLPSILQVNSAGK